MTVITLSRQMGSGGDEVAIAVAERLNLRLVGREIISRAAREAGVPEVALAEIDELGLLGVKPRPADLRQYHETANRLIHELAAQGNLVLVGRAGQAALAGLAGVLHVKIIAPHDLRLARLQAKCGLGPDVAAARLEASDRARADYVRRHYRRDWDSAELYDMVLNTAQLTVAGTVDLICMAAKQIARQDTEVAA